MSFTDIPDETVHNIRQLASDEMYAPLIMDLIAHPKRMVSQEELSILNPPLPTSVVRTRLIALQNAGIVESVEASKPGNPDMYYMLKNTAREVFGHFQMFEAAPLKEMFERIDHSDEFQALAEIDRPNINPNPVDSRK